MVFIKKKMFDRLMLIILVIYFLGCENKSDTTDSSIKQNLSLKKIEGSIPVRALEAKKGNFSIVLFSTGKIIAEQRVEMKLGANGRIESLPIQNGSFIQKNDLVCQQEIASLQIKLEEEKIKYEQAILKMESLIIEQGGIVSDTSSISSKLLNNIRTKSGIKEALLGLRKIKHELKLRSNYAPITGWIIESHLNKFQEGTKGETICKIINPASFKLHFTILENDLQEIKLGNRITFGVSSTDKLPFEAVVERIIPVVKENGLVSVVAKIKNNNKQLVEGMKVNVRLEKEIISTIIIPKEARVLRNNRAVLFTVDKRLKSANWKYIIVEAENDTHLAISDGLEEGDLVIYHNNLNLDQDARIKILN